MIENSDKRDKGVKIAITGKGGVGKTTLTATLAHIFASKDYKVIAVDADPDANLALAFGISYKQAAKIVPISELKDLIFERTGAQPGQTGGFFSLNPKVDDIPDKYTFQVDGIRLMVMGTIEEAGTGCICPESAFVKGLTQHLVLNRDEVILLDMEAGVEHLGRATAMAMDLMIVVVEPGTRSIQTAHQIKKLAQDMQIKKVVVLINKLRPSDNLDSLIEKLDDLPVIGIINEEESVRQADMEGNPPWEKSPAFIEKVEKIWNNLQNEIAVA